MDVEFFLSDVHVGDFGLVSEEVKQLVMHLHMRRLKDNSSGHYRVKVCPLSVSRKR